MWGLYWMLCVLWSLSKNVELHVFLAPCWECSGLLLACSQAQGVFPMVVEMGALPNSPQNSSADLYSALFRVSSSLAFCSINSTHLDLPELCEDSRPCVTPSWSSRGSSCRLPFSQGSQAKAPCCPRSERSCFTYLVDFSSYLQWKVILITSPPPWYFYFLLTALKIYFIFSYIHWSFVYLVL